MTETELKQILLAMKEQQATTSYPAEALASEMLQHIGSTDLVLRDTLIYSLFSEWITEANVLDFNTLKALFVQLQGEQFLFKGIGQSETDHVFTRSFSVLLITLILNTNNRNHFLAHDELSQVETNLIQYLQQENDLRGFVAEKGWAHSVAHAADAVNELLQGNHQIDCDYTVLLEILIGAVLNGNSHLRDDEDALILVPIFTLLEKGLPKRVLVDHIMRFPAFLEEQYLLLDEFNYWNLYANTKQFLRSLYFKTKNNRKYTSIHRASERILEGFTHD